MGFTLGWPAGLGVPPSPASDPRAEPAVWRGRALADPPSLGNAMGPGLLPLAPGSCPLEPLSASESGMMTWKRETRDSDLENHPWSGGWSAAVQTKLLLEEEGKQRCTADRSQGSATSLFSRVFKMQPQL